MNVILRKVLIFFLPMFILLGLLVLLYYLSDPFKVIKRHENFSNPITVLNRDYVSTELFLNNYKINNYNTFVLGSSRTLGFSEKSIKSLFKNEDNKLFYFDSSGEYIEGILNKLKLIDSLGLSISNVFMVICSDYTFTDNVSLALKSNDRKHLFLRHPIYRQTNNLSFQFQYLKTYFKPKFLISYLSYLTFNSDYFNLHDYMIFKPISIDSENNRLVLVGLDNDISKDSLKYYNDRAHIFDNVALDELRINKPQINSIELNTLKEISKIFEKHSTNLVVVVSPLFKNYKINILDNILISSALNTCVFDFSGNNNFTVYKGYYYENSHYRPILGDMIIDSIVLSKKYYESSN